MIQLIRGFKDILPNEIELWKHIEQTAITLFESFGFRQIRVPILEKAALFQRSIGEHTDIVEKEMYTFPTEKGELITLRPEATASIVRAYLQQRMYAKDPIQKLYTLGPMFRKERPQKGRYRQFYQINAEVFGIESPYIDAQMIFMLTRFFRQLSITGLEVHLNSLGCPLCRPAFKKALSGMLMEKGDALCSECIRRRDTNPLRVLDCKRPGCQSVVENAPAITDYLCDDCARHFDRVKACLERMGIPYVVSPRLVRGLDYYTRTAFEIQTRELGAQNAVAGGGRYDTLVEALGGPSQPAVGFAVGLDRLVDLALTKTRASELTPDIFIAAMGEAAQEKAFEWSCELGREGIKTEIDFSDRSLKALMKRANRLGAGYVLMVGDQELDRGTAVLRNMRTREQTEIALSGVLGGVKSQLRAASDGRPHGDSQL
ncbi:MAG: histidine--tRNA ligase [Desulfobacterales bacterium]|nr:histidine--tRNA ligase [Desulfobacterales bacterium]